MPSLCRAYNFPTKLSATGVIGILEFGGGYLQSDLNSFSALNGMPNIQVTNASIDGTVNSPGIDFNADAELTIDIQCAAASYFYATGTIPKIIVLSSNSDFVNTFRSAVTGKCDVLSISWGNDERIFQEQAPGYAAQVEDAAQTATVAGLVILRRRVTSVRATAIRVPMSICRPHART